MLQCLRMKTVTWRVLPPLNKHILLKKDQRQLAEESKGEEKSRRDGFQNGRLPGRPASWSASVVQVGSAVSEAGRELKNANTHINNGDTK
ncbi:hypothetical protein QE152_g41472 [Popillia japonica]|uniref:Uncharacterized protein n=1 Tax=Popillia japonica TaxID=7064 RepID=A0AAW1G7X9_POPJA